MFEQRRAYILLVASGRVSERCQILSRGDDYWDLYTISADNDTVSKAKNKQAAKKLRFTWDSTWTGCIDLNDCMQAFIKIVGVPLF